MSFRKDRLTKPIFRWAKGAMPAISATEREAIEAVPPHGAGLDRLALRR